MWNVGFPVLVFLLVQQSDQFSTSWTCSATQYRSIAVQDPRCRGSSNGEWHSSRSHQGIVPSLQLGRKFHTASPRRHILQAVLQAFLVRKRCFRHIHMKTKMCFWIQGLPRTQSKLYGVVGSTTTKSSKGSAHPSTAWEKRLLRCQLSLARATTSALPPAPCTQPDSGCTVHFKPSRELRVIMLTSAPVSIKHLRELVPVFLLAPCSQAASMNISVMKKLMLEGIDDLMLLWSCISSALLRKFSLAERAFFLLVWLAF